jgi:uncharacterized membrane protein
LPGVGGKKPGSKGKKGPRRYSAAGRARKVPGRDPGDDEAGKKGDGKKGRKGKKREGTEDTEADEDGAEDSSLRSKLDEEWNPPAIMLNPYLWLAVVGGIILVLALGVLLAPEIFWDRFLWRYYVAPVVADTGGDTGGISNQYNPVDTTTYALLMALSVFLLYKLLKRWKVDMDSGFFLAVLPFVMLGGFSRVMEDSELFNPPLRYFFITPGMWVITGLGTLAALACAVAVQELNVKYGHGMATMGLATVFGGFLALYAVFVYGFPDWFNFVIPIEIIAIMTVVAMAGLYYYSVRMGPLDRVREGGDEGAEKDTTDEEEGWYSRNAVFFGLGSLMLSMPVYLILHWMFVDPWTQKISEDHETHWAVLPASILLALGVTIAIVVIARLGSAKYERLAIFGTTTSAVMFFAHFMDAAATYIGIEFYNYKEMHVLPDLLIGLTGTALVMFPLKLFVVGVVVYFLDVEYGEEMVKRPQLFGMVTLAIVVLGLAPGIRDALRTSMGV